MQTCLGTCGICGGRVSVPTAWYGTQLPAPACETCGAKARNAYGPVIDMVPQPKAKLFGLTDMIPPDYFGWKI
jgi:hypothetical protein